MFNRESTAHLTGDYPIFLGQAPALQDSINMPEIYNELFNLYKLQKERDWYEDEVPLDQSRLDLANPEYAGKADLMVKNIAFQWELDSIASRGIVPLMAPFSTNGYHWLAVSKQAEIENLHWLTYSEIARQCLPNTDIIDREVMNNNNVLDRANTVINIMNEIRILGAKYTLGQIKNDVYLRGKLMVFYVALYALEGIEFMSSFAITFSVAGNDLFQGIAQYVQKIMADEQIHTMIDRESIRCILSTSDEWKKSFLLPEVQEECKSVLDEVVKSEHQFGRYALSEGRETDDLTPETLDKWVNWRSAPIYDFLGIKFEFQREVENPLPRMDEWMDIDSQENANMEQASNNYALIRMQDDIEPNHEFSLNIYKR